MPQACSVSENTIATDQSSFWDSSDIHWDAHRIGWAVAGGCTVLVCSHLQFGCSFSFIAQNFKHLQTTLISLVTIFQHCRYAQAVRYRDAEFDVCRSSRNYTNPRQQRQM